MEKCAAFDCNVELTCFTAPHIDIEHIGGKGYLMKLGPIKDIFGQTLPQLCCNCLIDKLCVVEDPTERE